MSKTYTTTWKISDRTCVKCYARGQYLEGAGVVEGPLTIPLATGSPSSSTWYWMLSPFHHFRGATRCLPDRRTPGVLLTSAFGGIRWRGNKTSAVQDDSVRRHCTVPSKRARDVVNQYKKTAEELSCPVPIQHPRRRSWRVVTAGYLNTEVPLVDRPLCSRLHQKPLP